MVKPRTETKASLNERQRFLRDGELQQDPRMVELNPDDDPSDYGLSDSETRFADEDGPQSLDKLFR